MSYESVIKSQILVVCAQDRNFSTISAVSVLLKNIFFWFSFEENSLMWLHFALFNPISSGQGWGKIPLKKK